MRLSGYYVISLDSTWSMSDVMRLPGQYVMSPDYDIMRLPGQYVMSQDSTWIIYDVIRL